MNTKTNLDKLSEKELNDVILNAEKALKLKKENRRREVISKIKELAESVGLHVEISETSKKSSRKSSRKGVPVAPKYQNPNDPSQKWSGRGMKPKWLKSLIEGGRSIEEFKLK